MKKILFILSSAALMFSACQKEENVAENGNGMILTATVEQQVDGTETKTSLNGTSIVWSSGDQINVFTDKSETLTLTLTKGSGTTTGSFSTSVSAKGSAQYAIYPASDDNGISGNTISFKLPSTQTYAAGTFAQGVNVSVAPLASSGKTFYNVCGVLKLQLTGSSKVSKIELRGMKSEKLWGSFSTAVSATPTCVAGDRAIGDSVLTLTCPNVQLSDTPTTFYIVVPQGVFTSGFIATVYGDKTESNLYFGSMSTTNDNTIKRSTVRAMNEKGISLDYQRVEFICTQNGGGQYINTEVVPTYDDKGFIKLYPLSLGGFMFGTMDAPSYVCKKGYTLFLANASGGSCWGEGTARLECNCTNLGYSIGTVFEVSIDKISVTNITSGKFMLFSTLDYKSFETDKPIYLFSGPNVSSFKYYGRCYYFKYYDKDDKLSRYMIPAVRTSDNKPGMFDLVTSALFGNDNSSVGDFTTGDPVTE